MIGGNPRTKSSSICKTVDGVISLAHCQIDIAQRVPDSGVAPIELDCLPGKRKGFLVSAKCAKRDGQINCERGALRILLQRLSAEIGGTSIVFRLIRQYGESGKQR